MVHIEINKDRCKAPRECNKCLEVCPESVFMTYPKTPRWPGRKAGHWVIAPVHLTQCTGCRICVEACPRNAITVTIAT